MSDRPKIPCSVGILTLNVASWIEPAFQSVSDFSDVYICDGNSTDGTQELARQYGVRIEKQFDADEPNQRIQSFGDTRTRCVNFAREPWYLRVDSDEQISFELAEEIRTVIMNPNPQYLAYKIPRKYIYRGRVIEHAVTYPNRQPRLFRRDALLGYSKKTHERPELKPGTTYGLLTKPQFAPMQDTYEAFWKKFESGLRFDTLEHANISLYSWIYGIVHTSLSFVVLSLRLLRVRLSSGTKLPLRYELARFRYLWKVLCLTTKLFWRRIYVRN